MLEMKIWCKDEPGQTCAPPSWLGPRERPSSDDHEDEGMVKNVVNSMKDKCVGDCVMKLGLWSMLNQPWSWHEIATPRLTVKV